MRSRLFLAVALSLVALAAAAGGVLAYDSSQRNTIANGITIGGIDVGGLNVSQATARVSNAYRARMTEPVVAQFGRRRFVLSPRAAGFHVAVAASVQQALARSRADNLPTRVWRSLTGGSLAVNIDPDAGSSSAAVHRFAVTIAHRLDRPARDATIAFSGDSIGNVASQTGLSVQTDELVGRLSGALGGAGAARMVAVPVHATEPQVTAAELASRYPTVITVDRSTFTLRLWKNLHLVQRYTIAVGMAGLETPAGLYHIQDKQVDPSWHVPNSAWAGALAGTVIPPGPADPIKARWMGIYNGAGIHGTDELSSLGSAASHGCIRMAIPDVIALYDQTPLGTPVYIA